MKKIFLLLVATAMIAGGCQKVEPKHSIREREEPKATTARVNVQIIPIGEKIEKEYLKVKLGNIEKYAFKGNLGKYEAEFINIPFGHYVCEVEKVDNYSITTENPTDAILVLHERNSYASITFYIIKKIDKNNSEDNNIDNNNSNNESDNNEPVDNSWSDTSQNRITWLKTERQYMELRGKVKTLKEQGQYYDGQSYSKVINFDEEGNIITYRMNGRETTYTYDRNGYLTTVIHGGENGEVGRYTYDIPNKEVTETWYLNGRQESQRSKKYNEKGLLIKSYGITYKYDDKNNLIEEDRGIQERKTVYINTYNNKGYLLKVERKDDGWTIYEEVYTYQNGNLVSKIRTQNSSISKEIYKNYDIKRNWTLREVDGKVQRREITYY